MKQEPNKGKIAEEYFSTNIFCNECWCAIDCSVEWYNHYWTQTRLLSISYVTLQHISAGFLLPGWPEYFSIFNLYLMHPASTVRQATSAVFKYLGKGKMRNGNAKFLKMADFILKVVKSMLSEISIVKLYHHISIEQTTICNIYL